MKKTAAVLGILMLLPSLLPAPLKAVAGCGPGETLAIFELVSPVGGSVIENFKYGADSIIKLTSAMNAAGLKPLGFSYLPSEQYLLDYVTRITYSTQKADKVENEIRVRNVDTMNIANVTRCRDKMERNGINILYFDMYAEGRIVYIGPDRSKEIAGICE